MASDCTEGEIERLRRALSQAHQELSDERARSAKLLDEVAELHARVGKQAQLIREKSERLETMGALDDPGLFEGGGFLIGCAHKVAEEGTCLCGKAAWVGKEARLGANLRKLVGPFHTTCVAVIEKGKHEVLLACKTDTLDDAMAEAVKR